MSPPGETPCPRRYSGRSLAGFFRQLSIFYRIFTIAAVKNYLRVVDEDDKIYCYRAENEEPGYKGIGLLVAPIVLAGGKSTRFGQNKTTQVIAGQTLIERVVNRLASFGDEVIVVLAPGGSLPPFPSPVRLRKVFDIYPERGSLGGVYSGLVLSPQQYNLVVASDMPFLNEKLLRYMIDRSPGYDVVIPLVDDNVEPLHAVYSRTCVAIIEKVWQDGHSKVRDILQEARTYYVKPEEINRFDPRHLSFFNVNTPDDLDRAVVLDRENESIA